MKEVRLVPKWHSNLHKRNRTGGKIRSYRSRRKRERGGRAAETVIGPRALKVRRTTGNSFKLALTLTEYANVCDPQTGKKQRLKITRVAKNPANRDYDRRKVITQGAVVETELGAARVTSRPGQHGILNAVLLKPAKK